MGPGAGARLVVAGSERPAYGPVTVVSLSGSRKVSREWREQESDAEGDYG